MNIFNFFNASARHGSLTSLVYLGWLVQRCCSWYVIFSGLLLLIAFPAFASYVPITGVSQLWKGMSGDHGCIVTNNGAVKCWGYNGYGQLGNNSITPHSTPAAVNGLSSGIFSVAAGPFHTCALTSGGGVQCWGSNDSGQLGDNSTTDRRTPVAVDGLSSGVVAIAAGNNHTCALTDSGKVQCWGNNNYGQLGDNSTTDRWSPVVVSGLTNGVTSISAGSSHTCALTSGGGVKCWGWNSEGQLGDNSIVQRNTPVAVNNLTSGVTAIAAGSSHTCALTSAGEVQCWGRNDEGQLGDSSSVRHLTPSTVSGLTSKVTALVTGFGHTCVLTSGGGVQCWGMNSNGQLGNNSIAQSAIPVSVSNLSSGVTAITAGWGHTCALINGGGVQCWGRNGQGQLGDNSTEQRLTPAVMLVFDTPPTVSDTNLSLSPSGTPIWNVGEILKGSYTYKDVESDAEKGTTLQWYQATDGNCRTGKTAISGATTETYAATSADIGKYLCFGITPKNVNDTGTEVTVTSGTAITKVNQVINFTAPINAVVGSRATLSATATSGLTVSFASTTPNFCTVSGSNVNYIAVGTCILTADQSGNTDYYAAAPRITRNISVGQINQTITFNTTKGTVSTTATPATATSNLVVTLTSSTPDICTTNGAKVTYVAVGVCTLIANQAGNTNYTAAPQVTANITVSQINQTITFPVLTSLFVGQTATLSATATSGLAVSFTSTTPSVCTVSETTVTYVAEGTCTLTADQTGDANYNAAPQITQNITVSPAIPPPPPLVPTTDGTATGPMSNYNQTATNLTVTPPGSVAGGTLAGTITNEGLIANVTIAPGATLTGGTLSGFNINQGTVKDITLSQYSEIIGGNYAGTINNQGVIIDPTIQPDSAIVGGKVGGSVLNQGVLQDVTYLPETLVLGGTLSGDMSGNAMGYVIIGEAKLTKTRLSHACLTPTVQIDSDVILDATVIQNNQPNQRHQRATSDTEMEIEDFCIQPQTVVNFTDQRILGTEKLAFSTFAEENVAELPPTSLDVLIGEQLANFKSAPLEALSVEQYQQIPVEAFSGLHKDNMDGLSPQVIHEFDPAHLEALQLSEFQQMPGSGVAKWLTNLNASNFSPELVTKLLPEGWQLDTTTGSLTAPADTQLALKALEVKEVPENVTLPNYQFNANTSVTVGGMGEGETLLQKINRTLREKDSEYQVKQNRYGVIESENSTGSKQFAFLLDDEKLLQRDATHPTGLQIDTHGEYQVTTVDKLEVNLLPAPKDPAAVQDVLDNGQVTVGKRGDIFLSFHQATTRSVREGEPVHAVAVFDPFVEPSFCDPNGCDWTTIDASMQPGIHFDNGMRAKQQAKLIYKDGTAQLLYPTVFSPKTFIEEAQKFSGVEAVMFNMDGTFEVMYQGQKLQLFPSFAVKVTELEKYQHVKPSVKLQGNVLEYQVQSGQQLLTSTLSFSE